MNIFDLLPKWLTVVLLAIHLAFLAYIIHSVVNGVNIGIMMPISVLFAILTLKKIYDHYKG